MKCQFCPLDFSSAYKIIPHIYFGHRKKICRQVRDQNEIRLKSPVPGSQFEHSLAMEAGAAPETIYSKAAEMFSVLEDHIVSATGEEKLSKCPYCQIDLSNMIYWVHLEEHMNMNNASPSTPGKTQSINTSSSSNEKATPTQTGASPTLNTSKSPEKIMNEVREVTPSSVNVESESKKEPTVVGIEPISRRVTRSKQKSQEQIKKELLEIEKKIALKKKEEDQRKKNEEEKTRKILEEENKRRQKVEEENRKRAEEDERRKREEEDLQRQKEEEELRKEIEKKMAEEHAQRKKEEAKRKKEEEERRRKQEELIKQREAELQRLKEQEEVERRRLKELERKRKDEEERRRMEEEQRRQKEADLKRQVDEQMRLLKQVEESKNSKKDLENPHSSRWDKEESTDPIIKSPVDIIPLKSPGDVSRKSPVEMVSPVERPSSDDKMEARPSSGRQTPASRTRSREVSGEFDRDQRRRRSTSGDKKHSSVWHKEREAAKEKTEMTQVSPDQKSKPVLTEEMERSIIYGSFKKKETREDKLVAVKREIEARFKAEEERRKRILEEKRKAEEKEREKQRQADEKLRKEREKLREEKRKTKKKLEELKMKEQDTEPEPEEESVMQDEAVKDEVIEEEKDKEELPTSYKRAREKSPDQYEKIKMEIKKIDKEIELKQEARRIVQSSQEVRSSSISPEPEPGVDVEETRTVSLLPLASVTAPTVVRRVVDYQVEEEEEEEEEDELEAMMREFQQRESMKPSDSNKPGSASPKRESPINTAKSEHIDDPVSSSVTSFTIKCPLWKDLMGKCHGYESAYDFLADVYLSQRKKIISRSRKARKMTLTCPENSGFSTAASEEGVSIEYFTSELPLHLEALCDHLRSGYTGEDRRAGDHTKAAFWQLLANRRDSRRLHCASCNTFPFKNEEHRCSEEQVDKVNRSLEELARDVETGLLRSEDLRQQKVVSNDVDIEMETLKSERLMRASEKKVEREKEERQIVIPRLPRRFGPEEVRTPAAWKYHVMAQKYGEVWCSETQSCILGYKYLDELVKGSEEDSVKVVRYRGDTWLDIDQRKVKVFYEYDGMETVAKVNHNNVIVSGSGGNHEQATNNLQQEVKRQLHKLKVLYCLLKTCSKLNCFRSLRL